jgi:hypothetical protein
MHKKPICLLIGALFIATCAAAPVWAHHSFAAEFDVDKPITMVGTVSKIDWSNPHVWIYISVKDDKGNATNWGFELGGPNSLLRRGWTRDAVKVGDTLTIDGYLAKDGSHLANARTIKLPDGQKLFTASSAPK